jgi:hypothetical protein
VEMGEEARLLALTRQGDESAGKRLMQGLPEV